MKFKLPIVLFPVLFYLVNGNGNSNIINYHISYEKVIHKILILITETMFLLYLDRSCDGIEVGRVTNNENPRLEELSGLAESNRFKDVFYSIEDSQNENVVYVINKNGTLRGM